MNFRCFSLVGFVCACAPFGVASNFVPSDVSQEGQNPGAPNEEQGTPQVTLTGGFFKIFDDCMHGALTDMESIDQSIRKLLESLGISPPQLERIVPPQFPVCQDDDDPDGPTVTLTEGIFPRWFELLHKIATLSNHSVQLVATLQQSLNNPPAES